MRETPREWWCLGYCRLRHLVVSLQEQEERATWLGSSTSRQLKAVATLRKEGFASQNLLSKLVCLHPCLLMGTSSG